jgi:RsiW-degrading membrane proteinase PrsW (M82 family)
LANFRIQNAEFDQAVLVFKGDVMADQASGPEAGFQLSRSAVFPLVGGRSTWKQEHLFAIIATIIVSLAFMVLQPEATTGVDQIQQAWVLYWIIALYIALMINTYIYYMCERAAPWWLIVGVAAFTFLLLGGPAHVGGSFLYYGDYLFNSVLPGQSLQKSSNPVALIVGSIVGIGLFEESLKAMPLFFLILLGAVLAFLGRHASGRLGASLAHLAKRVRISGPLDGIILGVASGTGFFLKETLQVYVPHAVNSMKDVGSQAFEGLVLLLGRGLPTLTSHSAYSGLFGYFIGLSVLRPKMAVYLLPIGYLSAATLHGGWDAADSLIHNNLALVGFYVCWALLSYALLGGAMFKAREIPLAQAYPTKDVEQKPLPPGMH